MTEPRNFIFWGQTPIIFYFIIWKSIFVQLKSVPPSNKSYLRKPWIGFQIHLDICWATTAGMSKSRRFPYFCHINESYSGIKKIGQSSTTTGKIPITNVSNKKRASIVPFRWKQLHQNALQLSNPPSWQVRIIIIVQRWRGGGRSKWLRKCDIGVKKNFQERPNFAWPLCCYSSFIMG